MVRIGSSSRPKTFNTPVIFIFDQNDEVWKDKKSHKHLFDLDAVIVKVSEKLS